MEHIPAGQENIGSLLRDLPSTVKYKVEDEIGEIMTVIVQNKIDLIDEAVVQTEEAEELAQKLQLRFYRISVKDNLNVNEVFRYLTEKYMSEMSLCSAEDVPLQKIIGSALPKCHHASKKNTQERKDVSFHLPNKRYRDYSNSKGSKHRVLLKCSIL